MAVSNMIIAIDFDGTVVTHEYPHIGDSIGAEEVLMELVKNGNKIILNTMRSGKLLDNAKDWFKQRKIPIWAYNENPEQRKWTSSPKIYANLYIDDSNLGCPLKIVGNSPRPVADWVKIREQLVKEGILD